MAVLPVVQGENQLLPEPETNLTDDSSIAGVITAREFAHLDVICRERPDGIAIDRRGCSRDNHAQKRMVQLLPETSHINAGAVFSKPCAEFFVCVYKNCEKIERAMLWLATQVTT